MNKTFGKIILFGSVVAIVTGVVMVFKKASETDGSTSDVNNENFKMLLNNLGTNVKANNGSVSVSFNGTKNTARFYNNGRVFIYGGGNELGRGTYSNGGYSIIMDKGKSVNNPNVYTNLNLLIN